MSGETTARESSFNRQAVPWKYHATTFFLYVLALSIVLGLVVSQASPRTGIVFYVLTFGVYGILLVFRLFQVIVRMMEDGFATQTDRT